MTDYTLSDLEALTGLPARTIRYYIAQGLIPSPGREGPSSRYPELTLQRLRVINRLRDAHLPLAAIRSRLAGLDEDSIASLADAPGALEPATEPASALDYIRTVLAGEMGATVVSAAPPAQAAPPVPSAPAPQPSRPRTIRALRDFVLAEAVPGFAAPLASVPTPEPAPEAPAPATANQPTQAPTTGERSQWERIAITTDIELHVRRPLTRADNRLVERLIAFARQLQEGTK